MTPPGPPQSIAASPDAPVPRLTIGATLAVLVAACLVPAMLGLGWMLMLDYRAQQAALASDLVTRVRTMRLFLDGDLATTEAGLRLLAQSSDLASGDVGRFRDRLAVARRMQRVDGYLLVDADGRMRMDTRAGAGRAVERDDLAATLKPVFAGGATTQTAFTAGTRGTSGTSGALPTITVAIPVMRGEQTVYAFAAALSSEAIIEATRLALPERWTAAILDREGRIVARNRDAARFVGQPGSPSLLAAIEGRPEGMADVLTKDGDAVVTAFSRSEQTGWTVAIGVPKALLAAALHRSIAILVTGTLVALVFVLWIAWRVSRVVSRAVGDLVEPALSLGVGRPIDLPPTALRETDAVGRAMRQASRMLATAQHHAYHDPLTNLRNRTLFDEMATRQIVQAYRDGAQLAILAIDLDGFKAVNDLHGHAAGDVVLRAVADRITALVRGSDVVSRRGGDEFSVLLVDVDGLRTRQVAEKLLAALSQPYPDVRPAVSASIGIARYPQDATTLTALLAHADEALYAAKHAGKRRVVGDF